MNKLLIGIALLAPIFAQQHIAVPLSDPNRPVSLTVHALRGNITVRGYNGHEVIVDTVGGASSTTEAAPPGLHRIGGANDISIESENNKVTLSSKGGHSAEMTVQVPVNTSLNVKTLSGGQITIEGINGEIEAQNLNGGLAIRNVSGSVVASSLNGDVMVTMASVKSGSPMSFTTLNGRIDVTLPANIAANFNMKTLHGDIYSDFDVKLKTPPTPVAEKDAKGRFVIKNDGTMTGSVNGGGPEYRFSTLNGNIYIRKK